MTIYTEALRLAKQGEKFRWQEAAAIRVASKNGGTFREYAELRDGHHEGEQKYSNWSCADEFRETFQHQYDGEQALHLVSKTAVSDDVGFHRTRNRRVNHKRSRSGCGPKQDDRGFICSETGRGYCVGFREGESTRLDGTA